MLEDKGVDYFVIKPFVQQSSLQFYRMKKQLNMTSYYGGMRCFFSSFVFFLCPEITGVLRWSIEFVIKCLGGSIELFLSVGVTHVVYLDSVVLNHDDIINWFLTRGRRVRWVTPKFIDDSVDCKVVQDEVNYVASREENGVLKGINFFVRGVDVSGDCLDYAKELIVKNGGWIVKDITQAKIAISKREICDSFVPVRSFHFLEKCVNKCLFPPVTDFDSKRMEIISNEEFIKEFVNFPLKTLLIEILLGLF